MDSQVEEIKQKLDIVSVIGRYIQLKKKGRNFWANCPFHGEKTPSFTVSAELQIYKCFGCGKAGDVFSFIQEFEKVDFREALEEGAKIAGIELKKSPMVSAEEVRKKRLYALNAELALVYNFLLHKLPEAAEAREYLEGRGITAETIKNFKIGYCPKNAAAVVSHLTKKGFNDKELNFSGTFLPSRYGRGWHNRFYGRLMFPIIDQRERVVGFSGRLLPGSDDKQVGKYINSPETEVYHKSQSVFGLNLARDAIRETQEVIIVEGEFDMIAPYQAGFRNIVAIKGTALTQEQLQLLRRYSGSLLIALDADFAGNAAAKRSIEMADKMGFEIKVVEFGEKYKDPDEAVRGDKEEFKKKLKEAREIWDFLIGSAIKTYGSDTPKAKREVLNEVLPILNKIDNLVNKSDYFRILAAQIGSSEEAVRAEAEKLEGSTPRAVIKQETVTPKSTGAEGNLEKYFMQLVLSAKSPRIVAEKYSETIEILKNQSYKKILGIVRTTDGVNLGELAGRIPAELREMFNEAVIKGETENMTSDERKKEIKRTIKMLTEIKYREDLAIFAQKIAQYERSGQEEEMDTAEKEYNRILQELARIHKSKL